MKISPVLPDIMLRHRLFLAGSLGELESSGRPLGKRCLRTASNARANEKQILYEKALIRVAGGK